MSKKKKTILIFVFVLLFACPIIAAAITYYSLIRENSFSPAEMEMRISENDSKPQETQSRTDYTFEQSDRGYSVSKKIAAVMDFKSTRRTIAYQTDTELGEERSWQRICLCESG